MKAWSEKLLHLKDGEWELPGTRCEACSAVFHPERRRCPRCGSSDLTGISLAKTGELISCTQVHQASPDSLVPAPYWLGLVRLDGGPVIEALGISDLNGTALSAGQRVELVVEPLTTDEEGRKMVMYRFRAAGGG
jgi:uncharacterized OB-fold protein